MNRQTKRIRMAAFGVVGLGFLAGCGGGGGGGGSNSAAPPMPSVSVSVSIAPSAATLPEGGAQSFSATVTGSSNTAVTWSVAEGATGGAITTDGLYTAPFTRGTYHVLATSQADTSKSASATVTVTPPAPAINFKPTGSMGVARGDHTATLLLDGSVLVVGGCEKPGGDYCWPLTESELYDPARGAFSSTGGVATGRAGHTATRLPDGKILVAGGWGDISVNFNPAATAELYDPATGSFSPAGSMGTARVYHTATLLPDGKVLIAGGEATDGSALASAELYDPAARSFSPIGNMLTGRIWHTATALQNGTVLIAGGRDPLSSFPALSELYDPSTRKFTATGSMTEGRAGHTATLLMDGHVLVAGGYTASAELYDPKSGSFRATGSMADARGDQSATLLLDGRVLLAGGTPPSNSISSSALSNAELFDPTGGIFIPAGQMATGRAGHTATLLSDGQVMLSGGCIEATVDGCTRSAATAELYQ